MKLKFPKVKKPSRYAQFTALESVGAFAVLYGISYWCVPAAFIVGGLTLILIIERL